MEGGGKGQGFTTRQFSCSGRGRDVSGFLVPVPEECSLFVLEKAEQRTGADTPGGGWLLA